MPAGDVALYREVTGGTTVSSTGAALTFDATDAENRSSFVLSGSDVTVQEACRVLVLGGTRLKKVSAGAETGLIRIEHDPATGTFGVDHGGWGYGFWSDVNSVDKAPLAVAGMLDCVVGSKIRLNALSLGADITEDAASSFLQLYRLSPDAPVIKASRTSNINGIGTTYTAVPWDAEQIKDASFWSHSTSTNPENITWLGSATRALLICAVTITNPSTLAARMEGGIHVLKNGTALDFTQVTQFIQGSNGDSFATCRLVIPVDLATNDVLKVEVKVFLRETGSHTMRVQQNRAGIVLIALPPAVEWLRVRNASNQGANSSSVDFPCDTEDEEDAPFTHSGSSSEFTIARDRRFVLGYGLNIDRTSGSTGDDINWEGYFRKNNATDLATRGYGSFSEGAVSAQDYKDSTLCGAVIVQVASGDIFELRIDKIGAGTDASAVFLGGTGETKSLIWAFDLDDLTGAFSRYEATGEAVCSSAVCLARAVEARSVAEGIASAELTKKLLVEARVWGESGPQTELLKVYRVDARALGEGNPRVEGLLQAIGGPTQLLIEARVLGEAVLRTEVGLLRLLEARGLGESVLRTEVGLKQLLEARAVGEGIPTASTALKSAFEARSLGEALPRAELTLFRLAEARAVGEGIPRAELVKRLLVEGRALGEASPALGLRLVLGVEARGWGEALARLEPRLLRFLEARAWGEGQGVLLLVESGAQAPAQLIHVRRRGEEFIVVRSVQLTEVRRSTDIVRVPEELG